jgi:hypothetical protein
MMSRFKNLIAITWVSSLQVILKFFGYKQPSWLAIVTANQKELHQLKAHLPVSPQIFNSSLIVQDLRQQICLQQDRSYDDTMGAINFSNVSIPLRQETLKQVICYLLYN